MTFALATVVLAMACGDDGPAECTDRDLDGFGTGCEAGLDCDDTNPDRTDDCDVVPPPDCTADPFAPGCPCLIGATTGCYGAPPETRGVGMCRPGTSVCVNGFWGRCDGAVLPRPETCDATDQDCDGIVDDGVKSPCGSCTPGCDGAVWGEEDAPFEPGPGLALEPLGVLTLDREEVVLDAAVWVANTGDGTLSRIDAMVAVESSRYDTGGDEPTRVAVDYAGDAWVANRQFDGTSTVTKVAGAIDRCVDRNGDGTITTSTGPSDVLPVAVDECVLFSVPVGGPFEVARALAIDGDRGLDDSSGGNAWVGLHDGEAVVVLDGTTGAERDRVETPGLSPYAAAFDPWGTLWVASRDGFVAKIDRHRTPLEVEILEVPFPCYLLYGLVADPHGEIFMTGFSCDDVLSYQPATDRFRFEQTEPSTRGIGLGLDGSVWVAHTGGSVSRLEPASLATLGTFPLAGLGAEPLESIGVGVDVFGQVWIASSQDVAGATGIATRIDPADGSVTAQVPLGFVPHTQGDLTGSELQGRFVGEGSIARVFTGCVAMDDSTRWVRLHADVLPGAAGTVEVAMRHADDEASLPSQPFATVGVLVDDPGPYDLDVPDGGVLEVRLTLRTAAHDGAPRVRRVGVEWVCEGPM